MFKFLVKTADAGQSLSAIEGAVTAISQTTCR
jgi:hypothetical protein